MAEARSGATYQVEPDFAARQSMLWAIAWLVGAAALTFLLSVVLVMPGITRGIGFFSYGRLHGVADTALWFGWLGTASFAAIYAILPRIAEVQLHNEVLGSATTLTWSLLLTGGIVSLLLGMNQGRPLAELPAGIDAAVVLLLVFVLYNAGATVVRRRERTLYVSGWYLIAAALLAPVVFVIGNIPFSSGVADVIVSGFYQNGLLMLWFLPIGLAVAHYVVPIETGNSLYSYALARAGFWSLMFAGGWTGQRLFLKGPTPSYTQTIAVAMTFVLVIPVVSSVANLYATARGRWHLLGQTYGLRFAIAGLGMAATWIVLLAVFGMPFVSRYFGLTAVDAALRHLAAWGVFSAFAFALIYHMYPLMVGRDWYSRPLATVHFWASIAGVVIATIGLLSSGDAQAGALVASGASGLSATVYSTLGLQHLYEVTTLAGTAIFAAAQLAFAFNAIRTSRAGPIVPVYAAVAVGTTS